MGSRTGPLVCALAEELGVAESVNVAGVDPYRQASVDRASVYCLSPRSEGMPPLLEAVALGIPVVATACSTSVEDILRDGVLGRVVPAGFVGPVAEALYGHLQYPQEPQARARGGPCAHAWLQSQRESGRVPPALTVHRRSSFAAAHRYAAALTLVCHQQSRKPEDP